MSLFKSLDPTSGVDPDRFANTSPSSHFAWLRTRLGLERTLMAWVRTAISLIGFGFTIVKFFEELTKMETAPRQMFQDTPRDLGLALIGAGILAMLVASYQYIRIRRYLHGDEFKTISGVGPRGAASPAMFVSILIILIGLFAFFSVFFRF